jgi:hypothetical protein
VSGKGLRSALAAAAAARLSYTALGTRPPAGRHAWTRTNHRGEPITLLEGPAVAIGGVTGALLASGGSQRQQVAMAVAGAGAAAFGGYDDLAGNGSSKGFRGHLGALRKGELTTGAVKIAGIGATGLAAALVGSNGSAGRDGNKGGAALAVLDTAVNAGLIAGMANLLNLFDLRPGRAIKVAIGTGGIMAALPGQAGEASAAPLAAAIALLPEDLGERSMLGDSGANAIGAMLGVAATRLPRPARIGLLATVTGLTAASEVVSFTSVIERTAALRWLDMLGRRPAAPSPAAARPSPAAAGPSPAAAGPSPATASPTTAAPSEASAQTGSTHTGRDAATSGPAVTAAGSATRDANGMPAAGRR